MDQSLAPVAVKILEYLDSQTQEFLQRNTSPKLEETKPFQQFLLEPVKKDASLRGFSEAAVGDKFRPECAATQTNEVGFGKVSHKAAGEEKNRKALFLDILSAAVSLEVIIRRTGSSGKDSCKAALKHLLRPLLATELEWVKAKFECRK